MRTLLFLLAIFAVTAGIGTRAEAQNYPWCADYAGFGSQNCGFTTIQQCMAALSVNGGFCDANTQYVPPTLTAQRSLFRTGALAVIRYAKIHVCDCSRRPTAGAEG